MRSPRILSLVLAALTLASVMSPTAAHADWAYRDHRTYHGPVYYHPIHPVYPVYHHAPASVYWRTGHWAHTWHENRFGWWWVNGMGWSFYSAPVYPYPEPSTTVIYEPAPPTQVVQVPAPAPVIVQQTAPAQVNPVPVPGDQAPPSGSGMYYFCESSQLYYPYARTCSERWKEVPQAPID